MPKRLENEDDDFFFLSDDELDGRRSPLGCCLYDKISHPLATRWVLRYWAFRERCGDRDCFAIDIALVVLFLVFVVLFWFLTPVKSLDHFLWNTGKLRPSPYEILIGVLFIPLSVVSLDAGLRIIVVWSALKQGLLDRLEELPIRFAFNRLKVMGWLTMLSRSGLREQWLDVARSAESKRKLLHPAEPNGSVPNPKCIKMETANTDLLVSPCQPLRLQNPALGEPRYAGERGLRFMRAIELKLAEFSQELLRSVLIPYWKDEHTRLVESEQVEELPVTDQRSPQHAEHEYPATELRAGRGSSPPQRILLAEEFVAIRYMSLIRAVLANLRFLMFFVSASFVLAIVAWNSYPFQPHQFVDWIFTGLLVLLGSGIVWVLAQMHRDPILSRITDTKANKLGWDFYVRVVSFGALPVLAWLAYQFPDVGSAISKFLQPVVPVIK